MPCFRFYGSYIDRAGDYMTTPVFAEMAVEAERKLGMEAGWSARGFSIDPDWDLVLLHDGTTMSRAEWLGYCGAFDKPEV